MKGTRLVTVRVRRSDLARALTLTDGGLESRENHDWDGVYDPDIAVAEYSVWYGPETDDVTYAWQAINQVHANLEAAGIWYEDNSNGVVSSGGPGYSRYIVSQPGSSDPAQRLIITALDDEDFTRQWEQFAPGVSLDGFDVEVIRPN